MSKKQSQTLILPNFPIVDFREIVIVIKINFTIVISFSPSAITVTFFQGKHNIFNK